jgi:predicted permease
VERAAALPGVRDAGAVSELPLGEMNNMGTFEIEGRTSLPGADLPHGDWRSASPGYFAAMGLGLVAGRLFDARDAGGAPPVAIVDELCAAKYWPGENPVGHRLTLDGGRNPTWRQIVGVVRTVHHEALDIVPRGTVYFPLAQRATASVFLVVHADGDARRVIPDLRAAVRSLDPALPLFDVRSLEERLGGTLGRRRIATWLIGVFALVAAALAGVGVYGVISADVTSRAKEIAIRMALGADRAAVVGLIVREGAAMTAAGVAGGAALALVTTRLASGLLFGVSAHDPMTYGVLAAVLVALATAAAIIPARRAAGVNPAATLR